ncbi:MAG TPA: crossover junction endodeoxyribonuclease RuvC [Bacteroidota bacterium]|nr:crossover junction endodeoxyribonuclease RuvC [Bacteroidota bacterium]
MVVLGIDPGTLVTGYGIIEGRKGNMRMISSGAIRNTVRTPMPLRLKHIFETLSEIIDEYRPDEFAIETAFYGKNAQSALKLGHARGVALLVAVTRNIPTHEYSPREVKKAIVGKGSASKEQVQYMVRSLLCIKDSPKQYDITDALAVSICHFHRMHNGVRSSPATWKSFVSAHPERVAGTRVKRS